MARPSLYMSKCHIVGNLMHLLIILTCFAFLKTKRVHRSIIYCLSPSESCNHVPTRLQLLLSSYILHTVWTQVCPQGYETFFMLNSTKHGISTAHKTKTPTKKKEVSCFESPEVAFIMLINVKCQKLLAFLHL